MNTIGINDKKYHVVYLTTNLINGKQYVGDHSTDNLKDNYIGSGRPYLIRAIKKYGKENFKREILEQFKTKEDAFWAQEKYIKQFNTLSPNGYNIAPNGGYGINECTLAEETKEKISKANKGKIRTEEARKKMSISKIGNTHKKGSKLSEQSKLKIRRARKLQIMRSGWNHSNQTCEKISTSLTGKKLPIETKNELREASLNVKKVKCTHCDKEFTPWGLKHHQNALIRKQSIILNI